METKNQTSYPIDHWSFSSMMLFLRNRLAFKKCYILKLYNFKSSPASVLGKACHKALEHFYKGETIDGSAKIGLAYVESVKDDDVDWGKTGSREKVIKKFAECFNGYIAETNEYAEILGVEKEITSFIKIGENELAIPAKSVSDLIVRNNDGEIEIVDHKFVGQLTNGEDEVGSLIFQAMFNFYNVKSEFGEAPKRMIFNEYKTSVNKNGDAQLQPYIIEFDNHPDYFTVFENLYNATTTEISKSDCLYLPNFQDKFDYGNETFNDYKAQIITVESPTIFNHKTGDFQYKEKKFVTAPTDIVDNKHLTNEEKIRMKLLEFGIAVEMGETHVGASIIQYTMKASRGVKMSQFDKYANDLALALKAKSIRILAPIMGTDQIGVEIPNKNRQVIKFFNDDQSINQIIKLETGSTNIPIGVNVHGEVVSKKLEDMPHLLIAGATGQGKSVMINVLIQALAEQNTPDELKFVMIDPKRVELTQFRNLPTLIPPIITEVGQAIKALSWLVDKMESRYQMFEACSVRNIQEYREQNSPLERIVVVIDEFADLILQDDQAEKHIIRLAQKARAVGIHIVLGTQRPSVDVVTGLIKANFPTRIAFTTSSRVDSQIILDQKGAENLEGKGDMLLLDPHVKGLQRLQGFLN